MAHIVKMRHAYILDILTAYNREHRTTQETHCEDGIVQLK